MMISKINMQGLLVLFMAVVTLQGLPYLNLFTPYDILIVPYKYGRCWQAEFAYEGALKTCGFRDELDELSCSFGTRGNVLQLWQESQNGFAALNGLNSLSQQFFTDDDTGEEAHFIPNGSLHAHNFMAAFRYFWCPNVTVGAYLSYLDLKLNNVTWKSTDSSLLTGSTRDFIKELEQIGNLNLRGWHRHGFGDLALLATGFGDFIQARTMLKNVRLGLRGGLTLPTGKKSDEDALIAFPFGYDGGLGVLGAGTIELWLGQYTRLCADAQFLHVFGTTRNRRIKIDDAQTDLLLLNKVCSFREPGFIQHYTLYANVHAWCGLSLQVAYQHTKQQEDTIFVGSDRFDTVIVNNAESLQEWTTNHIIFSAIYEAYQNCAYSPTFHAFYKLGFHGNRSIVAETLGFALDVRF